MYISSSIYRKEKIKIQQDKTYTLTGLTSPIYILMYMLLVLNSFFYLQVNKPGQSANPANDLLSSCTIVLIVFGAIAKISRSSISMIKNELHFINKTL